MLGRRGSQEVGSTSLCETGLFKNVSAALSFYASNKYEVFQNVELELWSTPIQTF